jgi:hypothetical protein
MHIALSDFTANQVLICGNSGHLYGLGQTKQEEFLCLCGKEQLVGIER